MQVPLNMYSEYASLHEHLLMTSFGLVTDAYMSELCRVFNGAVVGFEPDQSYNNASRVYRHPVLNEDQTNFLSVLVLFMWANMLKVY